MNAPEALHLNIQNSLASGGGAEQSPVCHLSFFVPYWVDNRTNMDLILQVSMQGKYCRHIDCR